MRAKTTSTTQEACKRKRPQPQALCESTTKVCAYLPHLCVCVLDVYGIQYVKTIPEVCKNMTEF
jgi:hypothetical protein